MNNRQCLLLISRRRVALVSFQVGFVLSPSVADVYEM